MLFGHLIRMDESADQGKIGVLNGKWLWQYLCSA